MKCPHILHLSIRHVHSLDSSLGFRAKHAKQKKPCELADGAAYQTAVKVIIGHLAFSRSPRKHPFGFCISWMMCAQINASLTRRAIPCFQTHQQALSDMPCAFTAFQLDVLWPSCKGQSNSSSTRRIMNQMNNRFPSSVVRIANLDTQSPFGVVLIIISWLQYPATKVGLLVAHMKLRDWRI